MPLHQQLPRCDGSTRAPYVGRESQASTRPPTANDITPDHQYYGKKRPSLRSDIFQDCPEWQAQFFKTKMCPFYGTSARKSSQTTMRVSDGSNIGCTEGTCLVGAKNCRFAHSAEELRPLPDLRQTKLCSSYTKRKPCKSQDCPYAHSPEELRTSSNVFYKVTMCNFYRNEKCWNGPNCRFAHGNQELRNNGSNPFRCVGTAAKVGPRGTSPPGASTRAGQDNSRSSSVRMEPKCKRGGALLPTPRSHSDRWRGKENGESTQEMLINIFQGSVRDDRWVQRPATTELLDTKLFAALGAQVEQPTARSFVDLDRLFIKDLVDEKGTESFIEQNEWRSNEDDLSMYLLSKVTEELDIPKDDDDNSNNGGKQLDRLV